MLQVKSVDVAGLNTGDVSGSSDEVNVFVVVDKEWASSESVSLVSELSLSWSDGLGVGNSFNIFVGTESLQQGNDFSGLFDGFDLVFDNQRKVGDVANSVTSGKDEGSHS